MLKGARDHALTHLIILSMGVAAVFLGFKFFVQYLPGNGFGGGIKKIVNSI